MTAIVSVAAYFPPSVALETLAVPLGLEPAKVRRFVRLYGLSGICRSDHGEAGLLRAAAAGLDPALLTRVRYVVRARTVAFAAPYPDGVLAEVLDPLGLGALPRFAVTEQACASGLLAIDLCGRLLAEDGDPDALALVLLGEKAFTPAVTMIPDVAVMGEASAAVLVGAGDRGDTVLGYASRSFGRADAEYAMSEEAAAEFRARYVPTLAEVIAEAADRAGTALDEIELVLPHNVNRISWVRAARELGLDKDRIFLDNVARTGHCFCADPFLNYHTAAETGRLREGGRYLLTSVGLGSTFAAMVVRH
ncbi:3-oxoacyl-[acyl-carrier-protein] synthase III C-terminal domain-containing protein [Sciscionella sediminilitoris]|uniref:3-oxoacyl-[acyl-carrier-protein] synthase III C-terminal domain-containing protein n=1 Tax=Sciscionella sediminilitoris TaxID=1445613 RepID=UPI0004DF2F83|nr:3-oxoacyl-[acyl-carrier-protein] synthase III C-terminal domain-containing protein [Sciscionella sp. SE31]